MAKSLLKIVKKVGGYCKDSMKKGMKKFQQIIVKKSNPIIERNLDKPLVSQRMYVNQSLISMSKSKSLLDTLISCDSSEMEKFLKNKDNEIVNCDSYFDNEDTKVFAFVPWAGGKQNHKFSQQIVLDKILKENPEIDKYYDIFLGGFGSVYNSLPVLIENGITEVYCNDINNSLINLFRQVQKNHKQVQRHLASIDLNYFKQYGKYHPETREETEEWFNIIHAEFTQLEKDKKMNPRRAALFMYLIHNGRGGMLDFDMDTKENIIGFGFDGKKQKTVPLMINKVEIYNKIFNLENIEFKIKKYETVINQIRGDKTCFILSDSPYIDSKYNYSKKLEKREKEEQKKQTYKFQKTLLRKLRNSQCQFFYYNNHHSIIEKFSNKHNYIYVKNGVVYKNGTNDSDATEIFMIKGISSLPYNFKFDKQISNNVYYVNKEQKEKLVS